MFFVFTVFIAALVVWTARALYKENKRFEETMRELDRRHDERLKEIEENYQREVRTIEGKRRAFNEAITQPLGKDKDRSS